MREADRGASALAPGESLTLDDVFDVLADRRRRYLLYSLSDRPDGVATVDELAEDVLARESPDAVAEDRRREVRTALVHVHLPKVEDVGVVEFDPRSKTVKYWSRPSLEEWLDHARHKEQH